MRPYDCHLLARIGKFSFFLLAVGQKCSDVLQFMDARQPRALRANFIHWERATCGFRG